MKFLYFSPEHISGTMTTMRRAHEAIGDQCRSLTLFANRFGFPDDICLDLPMSPTGGWFAKAKELRRQFRHDQLDHEKPPPPGTPPVWLPGGKIAVSVFHLRELVWTPLINRARKHLALDEFDIYQFEMGMEFYRDARWVKELKQRGKGVIAFYHGTDVRNRGIIKPVDETCHLRLTSELDLLAIHPQLEYIFLPIDLSMFPSPEFQISNPKPQTPLRIGHAARSRKLKGTAAVIAAVELLQKKGLAVELVLMENLPHEQVLQLKATCDIAVDQLTDLGGWGYGMSSLEFLAMGVPVITYMRPEYEAFLPDHPFVNANEQTVAKAIERLVVEETYRRERVVAGRAFVEKYHEVTVVLRQLYDYLIREQLCTELPVPLQNVTAPRINNMGT